MLGEAVRRHFLPFPNQISCQRTIWAGRGENTTVRLLKATEAKTQCREATQLLKRFEKDQKEINLPMGLLEWTNPLDNPSSGGEENMCHIEYPGRCFCQLSALKLTNKTPEVKTERLPSLHSSLNPPLSY